MQEFINLRTEIKSDKIERKEGFKSLILKSAVITGELEQNENPFIKMNLRGYSHSLELYSHLVPGSKNLNCFNILLSASTISSLANTTFHTLTFYRP